MPPAFARPPTTPGAIFSAACWSKGSNRTSGEAGRRSCTNIRPCSRRSPGRKAAIRGSCSRLEPLASTRSCGRRCPHREHRGMKGRRMLPFRAQLRIVVVVAAAGFAPPAWTQTYPAQNITLQVAFPAGGIADVVARLVGQKLSERFGHAVVVENRGGAGGNLAAKSLSGA